MKKRNEKGFFLVETMLVISVVAVVLLIVFKLFTSVYYGFLESENYNTVNAINALSNIQKYYESIGEIDTSLLSETNTYIELTNEVKYSSPYYTRIKEEYGITDVYLIDLDYFLNSDNVSNFPVLFRRYLKTLKNVEGIALVICTKGNEFSYVKLEDSVHITLNGDEEDEYGVYINVGGTFTDPGYTGWDGNAPQTEWENGKVLDTNVPGTYYLHYNFDGYLFRRKVEVGNYNASFAYTGSEQEYRVNAPGYYKIETWGAQGGNVPDYNGGYGGYSRGIVMLKKFSYLYLNIGGQGSTSTTYGANKTIAGGYNGGGYGYHYSDNLLAAGGGGATHIAFSSGILSKLKNNNNDIIIVSGGGSGAYGYPSSWWLGNSGGGYIGGYSYQSYSAGTQNSGYDFGQASDTSSLIENANSNHSGGGGGFYGGHAYWGEIGAGGGSGYIGNPLLSDKYMYCYNCETSDVESTKTFTTTCASETPTENCAKIGNGYAKITYLGPNYASE